ncbi:hypothetical protein [Arthrobacter pigmenti]
MKRDDPVHEQQVRETMSEQPESPNDFWAEEEIVLFENNRQGWKEPHEAPSHHLSLVETFDQMYTETSLLTTLRPPLSQGTDEFFDHVKALWAQRARERDPAQPPTELADIRALPDREKIEAMIYLDAVLATVFEWMRAQGRDPIPGLTDWPQTIPENILDKLDD